MNRKVLLVLFLLVFIRIITSPYPFDNTIPESTDHQTYLHHVQTIKDQGFVQWDSYWYAGLTFQRFYPPLSFSLAALLPFEGAIAYKLIILLFWAIFPITAYLLFKEFKLSENQVLLSTAIFSLTVFSAVRFLSSQMPTFVALPLGIMFLRHFIRLNKRNNPTDLFLSILFLSATILTHILPAFIVLVISLIYLVSERKMKPNKVLYCYVASFLITSFWTIPYLLELSQSSSVESAQLTILSPINFFHDLFGYYFNYLALFATILAVFLILLYFIKNKVENRFVVLTFFMFFIGYFLTFQLFGGRILILAALPIALMLATLKEKFKYIVILFILVQGLLFISYVFPHNTIDPIEEFEVANFLSGKEGRTEVIPASDGYMGYTLPKMGVPVTHGGERNSIPAETGNFFEYTLSLNLNCKKSLSISEVLAGMDLISKRSALVKTNCTFDTTNISENYARAAVEHVVVNKDYPDVISFFDSNIDFEEVFSNEKFVVYENLGKSNETISMTYYPHWKAEGYELESDEYGLMVFKGAGPINLIYEEPELYMWFGIISVFSLAFVIGDYILRKVKK